MSGSHDHFHDQSHAPVTAEAPTLSLLRLSAVQRLTGAAVVLAGLWAAVIAAMD